LKLNVFILLFYCVFGFFNLNAQSYNYSYSDPCTGNLKTIVIPINGNVIVSYYGETGSFSQNDFTNGTFESWTNNIFSQYGTNSPCSEIIGLGTAINITQGTALNVIGILNSLSTISDLAGGSTNLIGGSVTTINNTGNGNSKGNDKKGNKSQNGSGNNTTNNNTTTTNTNNSTTNNTQNQTNGTGNSTQGGTTTSGTNEGGTNGGNGTTSQNVGTQNPTQAGGTTTQGGSNETGNQSTNPTINGGTQTTEPNGGGQTTETPINNQTTSGNGNSSSEPGNGSNGGAGNNGTGSGSNKPEENKTPETGKEEGGQTNITGGATTTVKATPTSKEGGKPTIVASGDFVGFNFRDSEVNTGLKVTGGYTAMRWDGKRSSGVLGDYTSALRGPNITAFYAFIRPKSIVIGSGTLTIGFEGNKSLYGTVAIGQMFTFKKPKSLKLLYMGTVSYGNVYRESFLGTALIVGGTYDMRIGKRIDVKLMNLFVYAPYVSYYNDVVLKSPYVMLPSIGTNIKITKKFKFNINAGGAWDLKTSALNYTVTCGARMLVGQ
jgi:hypothetical protein